MRIRWQSVVPAIGVVAGIISDPNLLAVLPSKWSHALLAVSSVGAVLFPALFTNKPPSGQVTKVQYDPNTTWGGF